MKDKTYIEINCDGLPGPTHHYGGLAFGNKASAEHQGQISNPKAAALQGLKKMKWCMDQGIEQILIPPQPRPHLDLARQQGYTGSDHHIITQCAQENPDLLSTMFSSAYMWAANAATMTPSLDTKDGKLHITPANLATNQHRAIESSYTQNRLKEIFKNEFYFKHHDPLPETLSDEGAANHTRLSYHYGAKGIHVFVYGKSNQHSSDHLTYPARQTKEACEAIIQAHQLPHNNAICVKQTDEAIEAGVFHNDVIALGNESTFLVHQKAFENQDKVLTQIKNMYTLLSRQTLNLIQINDSELSLEEAVKTYFFNGQLLSYTNKKMALLLPSQCEKSDQVQAVINTLLRSDNPIESVHYIDLQQSMQNGGGPACLRLRVQLSLEELSVINQTYRLTDKKIKALEEWVQSSYTDTLTIEQLSDPKQLEVYQTIDERCVDVLKSS